MGTFRMSNVLLLPGTNDHGHRNSVLDCTDHNIWPLKKSYSYLDTMPKITLTLNKIGSGQSIVNTAGILKCYSQILCGGSAKNFRFWLFCIDLVANWSKNKKSWKSCLFGQNSQLFVVGLIVRFGNIFNIEVNGALAINMIVHNSLTQNRNRLKLWTYDANVDINLLMT